jgi:hypothetical protein
MAMSIKLRVLSRAVRNLWRNPCQSVRDLAGMSDRCQESHLVQAAAGAAHAPVSQAAPGNAPAAPDVERGADLARQWGIAANSDLSRSRPAARGHEPAANRLRAYFDAVKEGPGVWKWLHYFEPYHRHLHKFVGCPISLVEVGVYSGGSMAMWRQYFGDDCRVHGVDIRDECGVYEDAHTTIHIGDQADRAFWRRFRESVPAVDVLIDDGGHQPEQQMVTLEEMLPHLRPGGVYICEDVHGVGNRLTAFAHSLADQLNAFAVLPQQELCSMPTPFQADVDSVHLYPFVVVIEKRDAALESFVAPKRGTRWQPFL